VGYISARTGRENQRSPRNGTHCNIHPSLYFVPGERLSPVVRVGEELARYIGGPLVGAQEPLDHAIRAPDRGFPPALIWHQRAVRPFHGN